METVCPQLVSTFRAPTVFPGFAALPVSGRMGRVHGVADSGLVEGVLDVPPVRVKRKTRKENGMERN